ncbi:hypothetical protein PMZ80_001079 [Knufia obscura]|uniref:AB hydrolase-1 domain-containing protein n=2 Tax=Knufia TaxID=430999 RepID=A0AAN8ETX1_9EURO|nr:hypothetical protein PMZ80_001079 [Knufia obscura]KAK5958853.1 hypothetical protein OHC33_000697 [Knufia fluminis]
MPQPPPLPPRSPSVVSTVSSFSSDDGRWSPPRSPRVNTIHLTPQTRYSSTGEKQNHPYGGGTGMDDPRSNSTQSLHPVESAGENRRRLLLVYLHGFMGTETSFKSFPAHVHNLLAMSLADSHVVHTKIYPRYQSRKNISYARDAFSNWLTPHEDDNTDVILVGHSLGGILAAEVVLLPTHRPGSKDVFQHRILGHIAYDTPFLGMHPGVVTTGIASLFKSAPDPPQEPSYGQSSDTAPLSADPFAQPTDPYYNPAFDNDVQMPVRKGKFDKAFYFLNKHYGDLRKATASYVKSHLEFGGCMADYDGLKKRYKSFRPLEDVDALANQRTKNGKAIPRVRFVNYYTASTGRIKAQPPQENNQKVLVAETEMTEQRPSLEVPGGAPSSHHSTPRISVEEHRDDEIVAKDIDDLHLDGAHSDEEHAEMQHLDPQAEPPSPVLEPAETDITPPPPQMSIETSSITPVDTNTSLISPQDTASITSSQLHDNYLPPLPDPPTAPPPFDPTPYTTADPSTLKLAQKEHDRLMKSHERARKDHEKTLKDREKHILKLEKARKKQQEKEEKETANLSAHEKSERERLRKEEERMAKEKERMEGKSSATSSNTSTDIPPVTRSTTMQSTASTGTATSSRRQEAARQEAEDKQAHLASQAAARAAQKSAAKSAPKPPKPLKDRKFCTLPKKDPVTGERDPTWIRVYMENMDEVVAHTSLFFVSEAYARLVGDTAERIEGWVREDGTIRAVKEARDWEMGGGVVD